jgi:hypothetical protein
MSLRHTRVQHEGAGHWVVDFVGDDWEAEAAIDGVLIGCLYLPNGNPAPGPSSTTNCGGSGGSRNM